MSSVGERIKSSSIQTYQRHRKQISLLMLILSSLAVMVTLHNLTPYHRRELYAPPVHQFTYYDLVKPEAGEFERTREGGDRRRRKDLRLDDKDGGHGGGLDPYFSMNITEQDMEDMTVTIPPTFKNYRNPCWLELVPGDFTHQETFYYKFYRLYPEHQPPRDWTETYAHMDKLIQARKNRTPGDPRAWRVRCFPYFFLVGFTKAGTSDMRRSLSKLPDFVPGIIKESKFWNKVRLDAHLGADVLPKVTLSDYLDLYDKASEDLRHYVNITSNSSVYHPGIIGDFDPQTIWQLPNWQKIRGNELRQEPRYVTAHHLYGLRPQTKLLVLMRDPVERAFSHYRFFKSRKTGIKTLSADKFHEDMVKATKKLKNCFKEKSVRACAYFPWKYDPISLRSVTVSMYEVYIRDWLNVFPREQFLFIRSEDYFDDRVAVVSNILKFLEVDNPIPRSLVLKMSQLTVMNRSSAKSGMKNETRALLQEFFRPYNEKLAGLLGDAHFLWGS